MQSVVAPISSKNLEGKVNDEPYDPTDAISVGIAEQPKVLAISAQALEIQNSLNADYKRLLESVRRELPLKKQIEMTQSDIRDFFDKHLKHCRSMHILEIGVVKCAPKLIGSPNEYALFEEVL